MLTFLRRKILISTGIGAFLACTALAFLPWGEERTERIVAQAKKALEDHDLNTLAMLIGKHPSYLQDYRKILTEQLLKEGQTEHMHFVSTLKRLQEVSPVQSKAAHISMLISKGDLGIALEESLALDTDLKQQIASGSSIQPGALARMINLLRIAELYASLGQPQDEADAWEKFEQLVGWDEQKTMQGALAQNEALPLLERGFRDQGVDLKDYIRFRKKRSLN